MKTGNLRALECASGYGLNAIAHVLAGGASVIGYDLNRGGVEFSNELARRLGLEERAVFEVCDIHNLPPASVDVVFCLQTLEHVPRPLEALRKLADRTRDALVVSTPNQTFPIDGHDTGLAFAHWLSHDRRKRYAAWRGAPTAQLCRFLRESEIKDCLPDFELATRAYNFQDLQTWLAQYPCFFPYGAGRGRWLPPRTNKLRWQLATLAFSIAGTRARCLAPVLEGIYRRRQYTQ